MTEPLFLSCSEIDQTFPKDLRRRAIDILDERKKTYQVQLFHGKLVDALGTSGLPRELNVLVVWQRSKLTFKSLVQVLATALPCEQTSMTLGNDTQKKQASKVSWSGLTGGRSSNKLYRVAQLVNLYSPSKTLQKLVVVSSQVSLMKKTQRTNSAAAMPSFSISAPSFLHRNRY